MHLPSESLHGAVCPVTAAVALGGVAIAAYALTKSNERPSQKDFALTSLAVLALQAVNYPLPGGFSGHALGAVLAVLLLGLPAGVLSMAGVVTLQCLLFNDGGRVELGANVLNMSLIASLAGAALLRRRQSTSAVFAASALSVLTAVAAVGAELLLGGPSLGTAGWLLGRLALYHLPIALVEGVLTASVFYALHVQEQRALGSRAWALATLIVVALVLFPFASSSPDALETILATLP